MNSIKKHNELLENEQLSNSKVTYRAHSQKTGHKALIARHSSNKIQRKNIKKVFINLINAKFEIGIADTMIPDPSLKLQFYLKNESGELDKYEIYQGMKRDIMVKNEQIIVRMDGEFVELINQKFLSSILKGSHLEVFHLNFSNRHESSEFWNDWSSNKAWDEYTNVIHPILIGSIIEILSQSTYSSPPVILEVGGGTGRFACKLLNEYQKPSQYIMLELNEEELKIARKEFKSRACAVKTDIVNDSQFFQDEAKLNPILENSVDLAIASGVLTNVVLQDKDAAIKAMHSIYHYIKPGGFFVVAGHATSFLNSEDFKLAGFEVINTSIPDNGKEFYILRKLPSHT